MSGLRLRWPALWLAGLSFWVSSVGGAPPHDHELQSLVHRAALAREELEPQLASSLLRSSLLEGWMLLGRLELVTGETEAALEAFDRATSVTTRRREATLSLAAVHLRRQETRAAIALLQEAAGRAPGDGQVRRLLAQALVADGRSEEAVLELEECFAAEPRDLETLFALGTGYLRQGRDAEAADRYGRLLQERPGAETHLLVGRTYRDLERYPEAREHLQTALTLDSEIARARYYLGTLELLEHKSERFEKALEWFRAELDTVGDDPLVYLYQGMVRVEQRSFEASLEPLRRALSWPPARFDALRYLGRALLGLDQFSEAAETLGRALDRVESRHVRDRDLEELHYQLALALRGAGRRDEAKAHFDLASQLGKSLVEEERLRFQRFLADEESGFAGSLAPVLDLSDLARLPDEERAALYQRVRNTLARATLDLGVQQAREERFDRAADWFLEAAQIDPELPQVQKFLGLAAARAGRPAMAAPALALAHEAEPGDAELRHRLAVAWVETEQYAEVLDLLGPPSRRAGSPSLEFAYAMALVRSDRAAEAAPIFDQLLRSGQSWPGLHVLVGQAQAQEGDFDAAEGSFRNALELDSSVPEAHSSLGYLYLRQGRLPEAEAALRGGLEQQPDDPRSLYLLANVLELDRRPAEAETRLRQLLAIYPQHPDGRYLLGKVLLAEGRATAAVEHLESAVALAPDDANIRYQLGLAYQRSGARDRATEEFAAFRRLKRLQREEEP